MNILFAATFDVSHEYSDAFYVTRMFRYFISSSLFYLICCKKLFSKRISILFKACIRSFSFFF